MDGVSGQLVLPEPLTEAEQASLFSEPSKSILQPLGTPFIASLQEVSPATQAMVCSYYRESISHESMVVCLSSALIARDTDSFLHNLLLLSKSEKKVIRRRGDVLAIMDNVQSSPDAPMKIMDQETLTGAIASIAFMDILQDNNIEGVRTLLTNRYSKKDKYLGQQSGLAMRPARVIINKDLDRFVRAHPNHLNEIVTYMKATYIDSFQSDFTELAAFIKISPAVSSGWL